MGSGSQVVNQTEFLEILTANLTAFLTHLRTFVVTNCSTFGRICEKLEVFPGTRIRYYEGCLMSWLLTSVFLCGNLFCGLGLSARDCADSPIRVSSPTTTPMLRFSISEKK